MKFNANFTQIKMVITSKVRLLSNLAPFLPNLAPFFIDNFIAQSRTIFFVHFAQSPLQTHFLRQTAIKNPCTYNLSWQAKADYMSQRAYSGI